MANERYVLGVDQSTQGTKGVLVDQKGKIVGRVDLAHRQLINDKGWVSHDLREIYDNVLAVCREVIEQTGIRKEQIVGMGITNQRETTCAWNKITGEPLAKAIVWQCARASALCEEIESQEDAADKIYKKTGLKVSPYYPAGKMAWLLRYDEQVKSAASCGKLALGTIDSYLIHRLTEGKAFRTDYSNASRTQLFNLHTLTWDKDICNLFDIPVDALPEVTDSDHVFGETDLGGYLERPIPICGVLGDSHGALFGHNCRKSGDIKTTYGTGSSIMLNIGDRFIQSRNGLSTSLAWKIGDKVTYVLEGNINYTGAVISWLKNDLGLIESAGETGELAGQANPEDTTYLVPAFSGLGAPWWKNEAKALISGMSRTTGKAELVKAGVESIAYQINDVIASMRADTGLDIEALCVDGGPTRNVYLMQFQSDISHASIKIPDAEELSVLGAVYTAGISAGVFDDGVFDAITYTQYQPKMPENVRKNKFDGWRSAVEMLLN